ncbi:MAG: DUF1549 domain-containing protein, partial [Planctomycetales bacterium]|nr:DUF1549 domain-containing protein [Planctomycetales bacterium]
MTLRCRSIAAVVRIASRECALMCYVAAALLVCSGYASPARASYQDEVLADHPAAFWRFSEAEGTSVRNVVAADTDSAAFEGRVHGAVTLNLPGPRPIEAKKPEGYLNFQPDNLAADFQSGARVVVSDPGDDSPLDFGQGEEITLEAWVNLAAVSPGGNPCLIGKGRTGRPGQPANNQNYALRLREQGGSACVNFLFRSQHMGSEPKDDGAADWHRWTSSVGFAPGSGWHHVAVSYKFGEPESIRGYLDGKPVDGVWDMGGATSDPPVVDDDELWIGSTLMGSRSNSVDGSIDEVAIHRQILPPERLASRYHFVAPHYEPRAIPEGRVLVEVFEQVVPDKWSRPAGPPTQVFEKSTLAFAHLPPKYSERAVIVDRTNAFLIRAAAMIELPAGEHSLLIRSLNGARLLVDGQQVATSRFIRGGGGGHESVPDVPAAAAPGMRLLPTGHAEQLANVTSTGAPMRFELEAMIGGKSARHDVGELSVSIAHADGMFYLLEAQGDAHVPMTDSGWAYFAEQDRQATREIARALRAEAGHDETQYWDERHTLARKLIGERPAAPRVAESTPVNNDIDRFIGAKLEQAGVAAAPLTDDAAFLRRLALDCVGVIPTAEEIEQFAADGPERRVKAIDRYLADDRWADHWTAYWQDVLAENPGILKPMLNNTGPFRYWIYESLLDNKPIDRMASELIRMEGSTYYGGPAGFSLATQNDVPMAAKAHVIGQAFLAVELKCARCHDAPHHDLLQEDLFSLAAMLKRDKQQVPLSSSIPVSQEALDDLLVTVTLKPGTNVEPKWPFAEFAAGDGIPDGVVRRSSDSRERLAALITLPSNQRFARVIANRFWQRFLGMGI